MKPEKDILLEIQDQNVDTLKLIRMRPLIPRRIKKALNFPDYQPIVESLKQRPKRRKTLLLQIYDTCNLFEAAELIAFSKLPVKYPRNTDDAVYCFLQESTCDLKLALSTIINRFIDDDSNIVNNKNTQNILDELPNACKKLYELIQTEKVHIIQKKPINKSNLSNGVNITMQGKYVYTDESGTSYDNVLINTQELLDVLHMEYILLDLQYKNHILFCIKNNNKTELLMTSTRNYRKKTSCSSEILNVIMNTHKKKKEFSLNDTVIQNIICKNNSNSSLKLILSHYTRIPINVTDKKRQTVGQLFFPTLSKDKVIFQTPVMISSKDI